MACSGFSIKITVTLEKNIHQIKISVMTSHGSKPHRLESKILYSDLKISQPNNIKQGFENEFVSINSVSNPTFS